MGGKGRGEIEKVTGMVVEVSVINNLGKRYGAFNTWGLAAGEVGVLLVVDGLDVDRGAEAKLVNMYVNFNESDM